MEEFHIPIQLAVAFKFISISSAAKFFGIEKIISAKTILII